MAKTPVEQLICKDVDLSFLDSQLAISYHQALKAASVTRAKTIRHQQEEWFGDYARTCNAVLPETQRHDCIEQHLNDRLMHIWN